MKHRPCRPGWRCEHCAADWPCTDAKWELANEYDGSVTALVLYMYAQSLDAYGDLADKSPGALFARFLAWTWTERRPI